MVTDNQVRMLMKLINQSIMRHSDINLTMGIYTHTLKGQESEAVESLPDLSLPSSQSQKATGTDGKNVTNESLPKSCFQNGQHRTKPNKTDTGGHATGPKTRLQPTNASST